MENEAAGLDKNFVIYDTDDQVALIKRIMKEQKITDKSLKPKSIQSIIFLLLLLPQESLWSAC